MLEFQKCLDRSRARIDCGKWKAALTELDQAVALDPKQPEAYFVRGTYRGWSGDIRGLIEDCTTAIELGTSVSDAWACRGLAYAATGDGTSALRDCRESLERLSRDSDLYPLVYQVLRRLALRSRASEHLPWSWDATDLDLIKTLAKDATYNIRLYGVESTHWRVLAGLSPRYAAEAGLYLDRLYATFTSIFPSLRPELDKSIAYIFQSKEFFEQWDQSKCRGVFLAKENTLVTYAPDSEVNPLFFGFRPFSTLRHEGIHALLHRASRGRLVPPWFGEGMANYCERWDLSMRPEQNRTREFHQTDLPRRVQQSADRFPSLETLLNLKLSDLDVDEDDWFWTAAESLIEALLGSEEGQKVFQVVCDRLLAGDSEAPLIRPQEEEEIGLLWEDCRREMIQWSQTEGRCRASLEESVDGYLRMDFWELEFGEELLSLVDPSKGGRLMESIGKLRRRTALDRGLVLPRMRIRDNPRLSPKAYKILLRDNEIVQRSLDDVCAKSAERIMADIEGVVRKHAAEFLTRDEVYRILDVNLKECPKLINELVPSQITPSELHPILKSLLREGISIRDFETILTAVGDATRETKDPAFLVEVARDAIAGTQSLGDLSTP